MATQPHPVAITRGLLTPSSVPGRILEGRRRGPGVLVAWTLHPPQQQSQMQRWEAQVSRTEDLGVAGPGSRGQGESGPLSLIQSSLS